MSNLPASLPVIADYDSALAISFGLNAVFGGWRGVYKLIVKRQRALPGRGATSFAGGRGAAQERRPRAGIVGMPDRRGEPGQAKAPQ